MHSPKFVKDATDVDADGFYGLVYGEELVHKGY